MWDIEIEIHNRILYFDVSGKFLGTLGDKEIPPSVYCDLRTDPPTAMERRPWVYGLHVDL